LDTAALVEGWATLVDEDEMTLADEAGLLLVLTLADDAGLVLVLTLADDAGLVPVVLEDGVNEIIVALVQVP